jgi:hypothetical protein
MRRTWQELVEHIFEKAEERLKNGMSASSPARLANERDNHQERRRH